MGVHGVFEPRTIFTPERSDTLESVPGKGKTPSQRGRHVTPQLGPMNKWFYGSPMTSRREGL